MVDTEALKLAGKDSANRVAERIERLFGWGWSSAHTDIERIFADEWNRAIADAERLTEQMPGGGR